MNCRTCGDAAAAAQCARCETDARFAEGLRELTEVCALGVRVLYGMELPASAARLTDPQKAALAAFDASIRP